MIFWFPIVFVFLFFSFFWMFWKVFFLTFLSFLFWFWQRSSISSASCRNYAGFPLGFSKWMSVSNGFSHDFFFAILVRILNCMGLQNFNFHGLPRILLRFFMILRILQTIGLLNSIQIIGLRLGKPPAFQPFFFFSFTFIFLLNCFYFLFQFWLRTF